MKRIILMLILLSTVLIAQQSRIRVAGGFGEIYFAPLYSPDGSMLAFTSENYKGLWVYNFAESTASQITDEAAAGFGFSWSQDSRNILTRVARYEDLKRFNAVKIFDAVTGESQNLSGYQTFMPVLPKWSNGDTRVLTYTKKLEVYQTGKTAKTGALQKTAFVMNNKIAVGDAASGNFKTFEPIKDADYINLSMSPDGSKIVFEIIGGHIWVINSDGTGLTDLGNGYRPKWSFDSRSVVYMVTEDDGHGITASDIFIVNADGTGRKQVTDTRDSLEMNPSFSPDGKSIVFDDGSDGSIYILIID